MNTIRQWSQDPASHHTRTAYGEQIELEDGRVVSINLALVSLQNEFLGTVSIFRDITHQVEVDRLKSDFVATVSHELRTPMTPIKGYVEFLLMGGAGELNEQQRNFLEVVRNNVDRLSVLVNDLLDISRIEAGKAGLSWQAVDLKEVAEEMAEDLRRRVKEEGKAMTVELKMPAHLPRVHGDLERVRQIITNLVDNAYTYTEANGTITLRAQALDGEVQLDVSDTGIGIRPADQERIFERFYRGEHPLVLASAGTGLGLPIVKQLIEMHNGRIWIDSTPGRGSTFSIALPAYSARED
jgi:signal transduction histidine kinase